MTQVLSVAQVAERLNVAPSTIRYWITQGARGVQQGPASFKIGRRRMFTEEAVETWLQAQVEEASA